MNYRLNKIKCEKMKQFSRRILISLEKINQFKIKAFNKSEKIPTDRSDYYLHKTDFIGLIKIIRSIFLIINREKTKVYSFVHIKFWKIVSKKKKDLFNDINDRANTLCLCENQKKYVEIVLNTISKCNDQYGKNIALTVYRKFGNDVGGVILSFV
tara:strand:- start:365 stop:829 length:465 start_codon:yes stop_codon:yes gene_type:complete